MQYIKNHVIYDNLVSIELDGREIINPTEEQILAAGYSVYTTELSFEDKRNLLLSNIYEYDCSSAVNEFYYNGNPYWIDKATRVGLKNSTQDEMAVGREETTLILGNIVVNFSCTELLQMLTAIEVYAKDCYNVTAQHVINVYQLTSEYELDNYDYTYGYPDKLSF